MRGATNHSAVGEEEEEGEEEEGEKVASVRIYM